MASKLREGLARFAGAGKLRPGQAQGGAGSGWGGGLAVATMYPGKLAIPTYMELTFDLMYLVMDWCSWPTFVQKNIRIVRPKMINRKPL